MRCGLQTWQHITVLFKKLQYIKKFSSLRLHNWLEKPCSSLELTSRSSKKKLAPFFRLCSCSTQFFLESCHDFKKLSLLWKTNPCRAKLTDETRWWAPEMQRKMGCGVKFHWYRHMFANPLCSLCFFLLFLIHIHWIKIKNGRTSKKNLLRFIVNLQCI